MSHEKTVRVVIDGRVQGVGFRYSLRDEAQREGVVGWCCNLPDGRVEALLAGPVDAVNAVLGWCRSGPPFSWVSDVQVTVSHEIPPASFEIRR